MGFNTVVVIGDGFNPDMVSPEEFFGGDIDPGRRVLIGSTAEFVYRSGKCGLTLFPDRIDLIVNDEKAMPQELELAARELFGQLEKVLSAVRIDGIGLNCDYVFPIETTTGRAISSDLTELAKLREIIGGEIEGVEASTASRYSLGEIGCRLRIEPEHASDGKNLFVGINGHQNVSGTSNLTSRLAAVKPFRGHVRKLHDTIGARFR